VTLRTASSTEPHVTEPHHTEPHVRILAVCTGNICRSPAVERLLRAELGDGVGTTVSSAGVGAVVGAPIPVQMATLLRAQGVSPDGFAARQVTEAMLQGSDLVLALTREHRSRIVELCPAAVRRTFTLLEFARLTSERGPDALPGATTAERLLALLPFAASQRGVHPVAKGADDVQDPWGRDDETYRRVFDELTRAVATIGRVVRL